MLALQPEAARHPSWSFPICTVLTRISANCCPKPQLKVPVHKFAVLPSCTGNEASSARTAVLRRRSSSRPCCCNRGSVRPDLPGIRCCAILGFAMPCENCGIVIALATEGDEEIKEAADHVIYIPTAPETLLSILEILPMQLLAYHIAIRRGCEVDQPRDLAKSVTVE